MLSDFLVLERYYDAPETALFYEELSQRYGVNAIKKALQAGYLMTRRVMYGPDCGRVMFWLSEKGREKAQMETA
jgi:hypothetical protein